MICILGYYLQAADIEALKKEKKIYKSHSKAAIDKIYKSSNQDKNKMIIIFKEIELSDIQKIKSKYHWTLDTCFAKTVCVFFKDKEWSKGNQLKDIQFDIKDIEEIKYYKIHEFKQF